MIFYNEKLAIAAQALGLNNDIASFELEKNQMLATLYELHFDDETGLFGDVITSNGNKQVIVNQGYISLFPLLLGILPEDSKHLVAIYELISDPEALWSEYGICSLSKKHDLYGTHENYWRGPIWININYLLLQSLHKNYLKGPYEQRAKEIYAPLRENIVNNMFNVYENTGFVWEQYSCSDGRGTRSHPFTGWSALTLLIMAEKYQ
jgi:mannosyl-oligosaccharide glucosidase